MSLRNDALPKVRVPFNDTALTCRRVHSFNLAISSKESVHVVQFLEELVRTEWGGRVPKILQTDNGTEFVNNNLKEWCHKNKVDFRHGAPFNPRAQGQVSL